MRRISFLFAAIFLLLAACDTHQTDFFHNETSCENTIKDPETVSFVPKDHYDPAHYTGPVSYTHLTLPTIYSV